MQEKVDSLSERTDRDGVVGERGGLDQTDFDSFFMYVTLNAFFLF